MNRLILYLLFIGSFIVSCDKLPENSNTDPQGYSESQVVGTWMITGLTADFPYDWDGNGTSETNLYPVMSSCEKNNLYVFDPNKTGSFKKDCNTNQQGEGKVYQTQFLLLIPTGGAPSEMEKYTSQPSATFVTTRQVVAPSGQVITLSKTWTKQ